MHRITVLALWLIATPALAASHVDKWMGSVGSVSLDKQVDVPLYTRPSGWPLPCVKVTIGDNEYLMGVASAGNHIYFSKALVKAEKLKVRHSNAKIINFQGKDHKWAVGGEKPWTKVAELRIGEMVLTDVVGIADDPKEDKDDFYRRFQRGTTLDGFIGIGLLPDDIVWAIRPSVGLVSFARGDAAQGLKDTVSGTTVNYRDYDRIRYKYGKRKSIRQYNGLVVSGKVDGKPVDISLSTSSFGGSLASEIEVQDALLEKVSDREFRHLEVSVGDLNLGKSWFYHTPWFTHMQLEIDAGIGLQNIGDLDMVVDPTAKTVQLARLTEVRRDSPLSFLRAQAVKKLQPKEEEESQDKDEDEDKDKDKPPGTPTGWSRLADIQEAMGEYDEAIVSRQTSTKFSPRACPGWLRLGKTQMAAGKTVEAIVSLEKASKLYHAWHDLPLEDRGLLEKKIKKMEKDEQQAFEHYIASSDCHVADGYLAAALLSAGDTQTIETLYKERMDLDPRLAMATAIARLLKDDHQGANEPLRQAVKLGRLPWASARLGLAMTYVKAGDWETADGHFRRALSVGNDPRIIQIWLESMRSAKGASVALAAAQEYAKANPDGLGAHYGLVLAAISSGDESAIASAKAGADTFFQRENHLFSEYPLYWSVYSRYLTAVGRLDQARKAAERSLKLDPSHASAWLAMSEVEQSSGNTALAGQHKRRAAQAGPFHPGYALLVKP